MTAGEKPGTVGDISGAVVDDDLPGDSVAAVDVGTATAGEKPGDVGDIPVVAPGAAEDMEGFPGVMVGECIDGATAGEKFGEIGDDPAVAGALDEKRGFVGNPPGINVAVSYVGGMVGS